MKSVCIKHVFGWLLTALLIQSHAAFAIPITYANFGITPAQPGADPGPYRPQQQAPCVVVVALCITTLAPPSVTSLVAGGTAGLLADLAAQFPAWTPINGGNLNGTFNVTQYAAINNGSTVGANFALDYVAGAGDPAGAFHWIQRVYDNHRLRGIHGQPEDVIDFLAAGAGQARPDVPYYDVVPTGPGAIAPFAVPPHFEDGSRRPDAEAAHTWTAELYLVRETAANTVTIYNGVEWGWVNGVPEPNTLLLSSLGLTLVAWLSLSRGMLA